MWDIRFLVEQLRQQVAMIGFCSLREVNQKRYRKGFFHFIDEYSLSFASPKN